MILFSVRTLALPKAKFGGILGRAGADDDGGGPGARRSNG
jgi:hypothetical protein